MTGFGMRLLACQKENVNCFSVYFYLSLDPSKKKKTK
jgi:hypothetical protein